MDYKQKLRACRSIAEAQPILETIKVRPSEKKLIETGILLNQNPDPRQQSHGEDFFVTAFRDIDGRKIKESTVANMDVGKDMDSVEKRLKEADEITGEKDSHQSSDIDMPYPKEGTDAPQSDIESMQTASGEDQMKEAFPMGGGMPGMGGMPQPGMPPMAPDLMKQMSPQMPQMPPMNSGQMMRQMQYTYDVNTRAFFNRYVKPLVQETKKLREAYVALDKKMQETQSLSGHMKLDIDRVKEHAMARPHIRETTEDSLGNIPIPSPTRFVRVELDEKRNRIAELDKSLSKRAPGIE